MSNVISPSQLLDRKTPYDEQFFATLGVESLDSARVIVPIVMDLLAPRSVVDVGCGTGAWLRAFKDHGVTQTFGYDGPWVDRSKLVIPEDEFRCVDLRNMGQITHKCELAVCLEVGEHLPHQSARRLVEVLVACAPHILFSAAVPGQSGTAHINEQWPSFWQRLFEDHGYVRLDPIRRRIFGDRRVMWWYRQNTYLFVSPDSIARSLALQAEQRYAAENDMEMVHTIILSRYTTLSGLLKEIPRATWRVAQRLMSR